MVWSPIAGSNVALRCATVSGPRGRAVDLAVPSICRDTTVARAPEAPDDQGSPRPTDAPGRPGDVGNALSYADAGVNLAAADASIPLISQHVERTRRPEVVSDIGGFGGLFQLDPGKWREPVLVSGTDGVGTKVDLARRLGVLDTVGIDLVAMVVDDLVVTGAEPLFFNDYISVGSLDPDRVAALVAGIAEGCVRAGCALVGGETAEHPGLLGEDEFDLAGFGVGIVERGAVLGPQRVVDGDMVVAMASSGLHSNGYSLVRRIVAGMDLHEPHGLEAALGEVLLTPTAIYAKPVLDLVAQVEVHALCHITGGGIPGNLPRVLPDGLAATVDADTWTRAPIFTWLAAQGPVAPADMWDAFNCGVGMMAVLPADAAVPAIELLGRHGVTAWVAGHVHGHVADRPPTIITGTFASEQ